MPDKPISNPQVSDPTLPAVLATRHGSSRHASLQLTIAFHPDTARIGEVALLPENTGEKTLVIGRQSPMFGRPGLPIEAVGERSLEDRYVSRSALCINSQGKSLLLSRLADTSRCRINGSELESEVLLSAEQLVSGVSLMLGHGIVLLLSRTIPVTVGDSETASALGLQGSSAYMQRLAGQVFRAAHSDLDVLVRGETGTGKELVAQAIHANSKRAKAPMVAVNMAAIVPALASAALFGSAKGSYSGATESAKGYFRQAEGGSLFLDEIGETSAEVQPLLLRALQQREVQSVGGAIHRVNVRVISATDASLEGDDCTFKAALRHRLDGISIVLAPLRDHAQDIGELLWYFLCRERARSGSGSPVLNSQSSPAEVARVADFFHWALGYAWPGNVRELENCARLVVVESVDGFQCPESLGPLAGITQQGSSDSCQGIERSMEDVSDQEFASAMASSRFEVASTARRLQVSRQSVYRRIHGSSEFRLASDVDVQVLQSLHNSSFEEVRAAARHLQVSEPALRLRLKHLLHLR